MEHVASDSDAGVGCGIEAVTTYVRFYRLMIIFNEVDESRVQPNAVGSAFRYSFLVGWTRFWCGSEKNSQVKDVF